MPRYTYWPPPQILDPDDYNPYRPGYKALVWRTGFLAAQGGDGLQDTPYGHETDRATWREGYNTWQDLRATHTLAATEPAPAPSPSTDPSCG